MGDGGNNPRMAEAALRRWRLFHGRRKPSTDGRGCSQIVETIPWTAETIHGWQRLLSDGGDSSTDDGDYPRMAEAALGRWRLFHGRRKPSTDGRGCSQTVETPPQTTETIPWTAETIQGWQRLLSDGGDYSME